MSSTKPWQLLSTQDVSISEWLPVEARTYQKPDGGVVTDFTVVTVPNVSLIIPITEEQKIVMVRQFKPGAGTITLEFPAGRLKPGQDYLQGAESELLEETGMRANRLISLGETVTFPTKGSERVMNFIGVAAQLVSDQKLDEHEDIEVVYLSKEEVIQAIITGRINTAPSLTAWYLANLKHSAMFT